MHKDWVKRVTKLIKNLDNTSVIMCPEYGAYELDYVYVVIKEERLGSWKK